VGQNQGKKLKPHVLSRKRGMGPPNENGFSLGRRAVWKGGNVIPLYLQYFSKNPTPLMILYSV